MLRTLALCSAIALIPSLAVALTADERTMLDEVQKTSDNVLRYCRQASGEFFMFASVTAPAPVQNPFAPALTPPGGPAPGGLIGYYQFSLFPSPQGNQIPKLNWHAVNVSDADRRNGIDSRYALDFFAQSYRIYDIRNHSWGNWTNAGSFGNDVHYASFTAERFQGRWTVKGGFLIDTGGVLKAPNSCSDIPAG